MGDSTDEPFDTTLLGSTRAAPSTRQRAKVTNARENTLLWNLMWPDAGLPDGSFYFDKQPNMLNQFLVIKNMATGGAPIKVNAGTGPRSSNRRPWSIQVTTYSQFRTAEWAIRSIRTDSPTTSQITMTVAEVD